MLVWHYYTFIHYYLEKIKNFFQNSSYLLYMCIVSFIIPKRISWFGLNQPRSKSQALSSAKRDQISPCANLFSGIALKEVCKKYTNHEWVTPLSHQFQLASNLWSYHSWNSRQSLRDSNAICGLEWFFSHSLLLFFSLALSWSGMLLSFRKYILLSRRCIVLLKIEGLVMRLEESIMRI